MSRLMQNLSRFQLITFDVTDTLLKFKTAPAIQYAKTAAEFGYANIDQLKMSKNFSLEFKKLAKNYPNFGKNTDLKWDDWWRTLVINIFKASSVGSISDQHLNAIANKLVHLYSTDEGWVKFTRADDMLNRLREQQKMLGIISNFDPRLPLLIDNMKLPKFDFILTSYEAGVQKPEPQIFKLALERASAIKRTTIKPNQALHIGNTEKLDYCGAKNAGWSSILIGETECHKNKHYSFNNLESFIHALENDIIHW